MLNFKVYCPVLKKDVFLVVCVLQKISAGSHCFVWHNRSAGIWIVTVITDGFEGMFTVIKIWIIFENIMNQVLLTARLNNVSNDYQVSITVLHNNSVCRK